MRRRTARTFVIVGVIVLLLALLAIATLVRTTGRLHYLADQMSPAAIATAELETAYVDQETGVRGYALARRSDFLEPYRTGRSEEAAAIKQLDSLLKDKPELRRDLAQVRVRADSWHRRVAEPTIAQAQTGSTVSAADLDKGKSSFDAIRSQLNRLDRDIATQRADARLHMGRAMIFLEIVVGVALAGVVAIGYGLWRAQQRWVLAPLLALGDEVGRVADGDLGYEIRVEGPRELTALARDVDLMRQSVVSYYEEAVHSQKAVAEQARLLAEQADELRRSNVELEQFAYVASHDLQEPLRKVASFCQMLERRYKGQLDDRADQYIAFAVDGAKRMQRLINDLLAFSRVGRTTGEFTEIDCNTALAHALSNLDTRIEETSAEVTSGTLPTVRGDLTLLTQVFQNLISNAIKFHGEERPRIHLDATRAGEEWEFCCQDNGIGIEPEYADRVFVIFQRLHAKEAYEGTGIGLAMCKKIVEFHGGRIWIDADSGNGTTVRWALPASADEEPEAPQPAPRAPEIATERAT